MTSTTQPPATSGHPHTEWAAENSLTAPSDRTEKKIETLVNAPALTEEEAKDAIKILNNKSYIGNFPTIERRYADPEVPLQKIGLISFVPAKGATPNEKGVYGFAKLRGNFATETEADEKAEHIIRNVDSYHQIYHAYVGRPFPLTTSSDYSGDTRRIDLTKEMTVAISDDVKRKREKEQKEIQEIKDRETELLEDVKKDEENIQDRYTTLRVKKAQLTWTYSEYSKKLKQMVGLIAKARREIEILEEKDESLLETYMKKYMDARKSAGLPVDRADDSFMKYLVEDLLLPEVDEEYARLYQSQPQEFVNDA